MNVLPTQQMFLKQV